MISQEEKDLVLALATSSGSLDRSPKKNWVENAGNLPPYIRKIARAIEKSGKPLSTAIPMAISRVKRWAAGGQDVNADTRAKAAKAVAQWETLKAKNKAKKVVKASNEQGDEYIVLLSGNPHLVGDMYEQWNMYYNAVRREIERATPSEYASEPAHFPYMYPVEVWSTYIIVEREADTYRSIPRTFFRVSYTRDGKNIPVFTDAVEVTQTYVLAQGEDEEIELSDNEMSLLGVLSA